MKNELEDPENIFTRECYRTFEFLISQHGFIGPRLDLTTTGLVIVSYFKNQVGVECVYELRDDDVSVRIIRTEDGQSPVDYRKNSKGIVVREFLTQLLINRGVRAFGFTKKLAVAGDVDKSAVYRNSLEAYAQMLKNHADDVLQGSESILNEI